MNRTTAIATGAVGGYAVALFVAIAVFFRGSPDSIGVAVGFGVVTILAAFGVSRIVAGE
ncbi:hypothetical protein ACH9L7_15015 [Haloferax sp. S1W]|uniref:hypothetical protein n=1 Tax=Haloferax sp. S1W TaxID=3377110 RepID=UPI0037C6826D